MKFIFSFWKKLNLAIIQVSYKFNIKSNVILFNFELWFSEILYEVNFLNYI